ncbi:MAG: hypothetical protein ACFFDI_23795 [Promethearchaeota archaeon]
MIEANLILSFSFLVLDLHQRQMEILIEIFSYCCKWLNMPFELLVDILIAVFLDISDIIFQETFDHASVVLM